MHNFPQVESWSDKHPGESRKGYGKSWTGKRLSTNFGEQTDIVGDSLIQFMLRTTVNLYQLSFKYQCIYVKPQENYFHRSRNMNIRYHTNTYTH